MLQNTPARGKRNRIAAKEKVASWRVDYLLMVLGSGSLQHDNQVR